MKQFLRTFLMLIALFILPLGCGAKEDYVDYGEDVEYDDAVAKTLSDKEIKKMLKGYPDWRTNPQEFVEKAFVSDEIISVENGLATFIDQYIGKNASLKGAFGIAIDPTGLNIVRLDQYHSDQKIEKEVLVIERVKSIFDLDETETYRYPLTSYFHLYNRRDIKSPYVSYSSVISTHGPRFYVVSLVKIKKNGKSDIVWHKVYPNFSAYYASETKTNTVWVDTNLNNKQYFNEFFKKDFSRIMRDKALKEYQGMKDRFAELLTKDYDKSIYHNFESYSNQMRYNVDLDYGIKYKYRVDHSVLLTNENFIYDYKDMADLSWTYSDLPEFVEVKNKYQRQEIKFEEGIDLKEKNNYMYLREFYQPFVDEIFKIYIDYSYNRKLPKK